MNDSYTLRDVRRSIPVNLGSQPGQKGGEILIKPSVSISLLVFDVLPILTVLLGSVVLD